MKGDHASFQYPEVKQLQQSRKLITKAKVEELTLNANSSKCSGMDLKVRIKMAEQDKHKLNEKAIIDTYVEQNLNLQQVQQEVQQNEMESFKFALQSKVDRDHLQDL